MLQNSFLQKQTNNSPWNKTQTKNQNKHKQTKKKPQNKKVTHIYDFKENLQN